MPVIRGHGPLLRVVRRRTHTDMAQRIKRTKKSTITINKALLFLKFSLVISRIQ